MRYDFIEAHRAMYRLPVMCRALQVSKSGYFSWRNSPPSKRRLQDRALTARIKAIDAENDGRYGSPRIHRDLRFQGISVGKKRVERLMKEAGISARPPRRFVVTTNSNHDFPVARDLIQQHFTVPEPNRRWVTDITYIHTNEGWLFLAAIMDLCSRRIVGYALQDTMDRSLVLSALNQAVRIRQPAPGLIHHSDRGVQYAAHGYRQRLSEHGIVPSMSRRACCYDNAAMESFFHTLKVELIHRRQYQTRAQATQDIVNYLAYYNFKRRHSTIGYLTPVDYERQLKAA
jgi:transposase InsO family protein